LFHHVQLLTVVLAMHACIAADLEQFAAAARARQTAAAVAILASSSASEGVASADGGNMGSGASDSLPAANANTPNHGAGSWCQGGDPERGKPQGGGLSSGG
jgi:hypothetical protein